MVDKTNDMNDCLKNENKRVFKELLTASHIAIATRNAAGETKYDHA